MAPDFTRARTSNRLNHGFIAFVLVLLAVKSDQRVALAAGAIWAVALAVGWRRMQRS